MQDLTLFDNTIIEGNAAASAPETCLPGLYGGRYR